MAAQLEITESRQPIPTVKVAGEIDHFNCSRAEAAVKRVLDEDIKTLVIDMAQVEYVDTAGVAMIFWTAKSMVDRDGSLRLVVPEGNVRRILEMAGVAGIPSTEIFDTLDDSLRA